MQVMCQWSTGVRACVCVKQAERERGVGTYPSFHFTRSDIYSQVLFFFSMSSSLIHKMEPRLQTLVLILNPPSLCLHTSQHLLPTFTSCPPSPPSLCL